MLLQHLLQVKPALNHYQALTENILSQKKNDVPGHKTCPKHQVFFRPDGVVIE